MGINVIILSSCTIHTMCDLIKYAVLLRRIFPTPVYKCNVVQFVQLVVTKEKEALSEIVELTSVVLIFMMISSNPMSVLVTIFGAIICCLANHENGKLNLILLCVVFLSVRSRFFKTKTFLVHV